MIVVNGHSFERDGKKIGYIEHGVIKDAGGNKLGWVAEENEEERKGKIKDASAATIARREGDEIKSPTGETLMTIGHLYKRIEGGLSDMERAAAVILLAED